MWNAIQAIEEDIRTVFAATNLGKEKLMRKSRDTNADQTNGVPLFHVRK